jgi:hypothetical protein
LVFIVAAAVGAMLTGVGISLQAGGDSGPVLPFPDGGSNDSVTVSANRTTLEPGDSVEVSVAWADAAPVGNATVFVDGERHRTGPNGTAVVTFPSPGTYEIAASPPGTNDPSRTATTTVRVRRQTVDLTVTTNRSTVTVDESVAVTLQRVDTETVVNGTIAVGDRTFRTGADGRVVVPFDRGGRYRIVGRTNATDGSRFRDATATVRVRRHRVSLAAELTTDTVAYGNETTVRVRRTDTGDPVRASITIGNRTLETGADGVATLSTVPPGSYEVVATAARTATVRFEPATVSLRVRRRVVGLEVSATPSRLSVGNETTVTVRRADTGDPVAARVEIAGRTLRTGADGRVAVALERPGRFGAVATRNDTPTETFEPAGTGVVWLGPDVRLAAVEVPSGAAPADRVPVAVTLENRGNEMDNRTVTVALSGDRRVSRTVKLRPGARLTLDLAVIAPSGSGDHVLVVTAGDRWRPFVIRVDPAGSAAETNASR